MDTSLKKAFKPSPFIRNARLIKKGDSPPCLKKGCQCRGCFGWQNMIQAAEKHAGWRNYPLRCEITGLTIAY